MTTSTRWQLTRGAAERYEQFIVRSNMVPFARSLVESANLQVGEWILDAGCGTGVVARLAAERVGQSGQVTGIDVNTGMIEVARSLPVGSGAQIEWREESLYQLSLETESIDVVLCSQVLQYLADRALALSEMRRVLKPGGRIAVSAWSVLADNPYFDVGVDAVAKHLGAEPAAGLRAGAALGNADDISQLLATAGFKDVDVSTTQIDIEMPRTDEFIRQRLSATPVAGLFAAAPQLVQDAIVQQVSQQLAPFAGGTEFRVPFRSHMVRARK